MRDISFWPVNMSIENTQPSSTQLNVATSSEPLNDATASAGPLNDASDLLVNTFYNFLCWSSII
jgi:hypothetical protein